jgi:hypothetical protein
MEKLKLRNFCLSVKAAAFLDSEHKELFLTPFHIGSNQILFYGCPVIMAGNSSLIKAQISKKGESKDPYPLFTMKEVLEEPATVVWLQMNGYQIDIQVGRLGIIEHLQYHELHNYFDTDQENHWFHVAFLERLVGTEGSFNEDEKKIKNTLNDNKDAVIKIINTVCNDFRVGDRFSFLLKFINMFPEFATRLDYVVVKNKVNAFMAVVRRTSIIVADEFNKDMEKYSFSKINNPSQFWEATWRRNGKSQFYAVKSISPEAVIMDLYSDN